MTSEQNTIELTPGQKRYRAKKHKAEQDRLIAAAAEKNKARLAITEDNGNGSYTYRGYTIKVEQDQDAANPRTEWDNASKMICFHRRYNLGDKHDFSGPQEVMDFLNMPENKGSIVQPLYLYDHSGLTISTRSFHGRLPQGHAEWDSMQVGVVYLTPEMIRETYMVKRITKAILERAKNLILAEVREYDDYLRGDVYGYRVEDKDGEEIDSVWGYYGDPKESGLLEAAWDSIDYQIEELTKPAESKKEDQPKPNLLDACRKAEQALKDIINASGNQQPYDTADLYNSFSPDLEYIRAAIAAAEAEAAD
jgi:hypothetical protein